MIQGTAIRREGKCTLYRREYFCGRTTPIVEYYIEYNDYAGTKFNSCDYRLKRDAMAEFDAIKYATFK